MTMQFHIVAHRSVVQEFDIPAATGQIVVDPQQQRSWRDDDKILAPDRHSPPVLADAPAHDHCCHQIRMPLDAQLLWRPQVVARYFDGQAIAPESGHHSSTGISVTRSLARRAAGLLSAAWKKTPRPWRATRSWSTPQILLTPLLGSEQIELLPAQRGQLQQRHGDLQGAARKLQPIEECAGGARQDRRAGRWLFQNLKCAGNGHVLSLNSKLDRARLLALSLEPRREVTRESVERCLQHPPVAHWTIELAPRQKAARLGLERNGPIVAKQPALDCAALSAKLREHRLAGERGELCERLDTERA